MMFKSVLDSSDCFCKLSILFSFFVRAFYLYFLDLLQVFRQVSRRVGASLDALVFVIVLPHCLAMFLDLFYLFVLFVDDLGV